VGLPARIRPVDVEIGHPRPVLTDFSEVDQVIPHWLRLGPLVLEREVAGAREIEVPVLVDVHGHAVAVGDRDVTLRDGRRHLIVESPAPGLSRTLRNQLARTAESFAEELAWRGLCSVRFLLAPDGRAYLLQLRPGLQPWHGATEVAYDVDLVDAQMRLATRDSIRWERASIQPRVASVWAGLVADEKGCIEGIGDKGLRIDPEVVVGDAVSVGEPLVGVVAQGPTRQVAIVRLRAWIDAEPIAGVVPSRRALDACIGAPAWWSGPIDRDAACVLTAKGPSTV
jgi:acetyl/propionyl-CoA carboxylase alpha subunit